jgi:hypothetical protein
LGNLISKLDGVAILAKFLSNEYKKDIQFEGLDYRNFINF